MDEVNKIVLKQGKATPFLYRHPWVFSGAIKKKPDGLADGDMVALYGNDADFIAWGLFNSRSAIAVRLYSWNYNIPLDSNFWHMTINDSLLCRQQIAQVSQQEDASRLIFSEGDGISGLVVDRYGPYLVMQVNSLALMRRLDDLLGHLVNIVNPRGIILRNEDDINRQEGIERSNGVLHGEIPDNGTFEIKENDLRFSVDIATGQKTGFYLDQRENRMAVSRYCRHKKVLDVCCYTGAFALYAAKAGAKEVTGIDISQPAIDRAMVNAYINNIDSIKFIKDDAFRFLQNIPEYVKYEVIILDPPRFAQSRGSIEQALKGYTRLNALAMRSLVPGGILVTCSCSGRVSEDRFLQSVAEAAKAMHRFVQVLEKRSHPPDHPVSLHCPESNYLKCLICRVL